MAITLRIGTPVEGMDFYGRKKEIELAQRRLQGNNLMLAAPRRVGKTSFAKIVMQKMGEQSWNGVFVDLEGLTETSAFFTTIHKELLKLPCIEKSQKIKEILRDHAPNINFSATISGVEAKMAMTRCWIIVRLLMPNQSVGMNQRVNVTSNTKNILMSLKVALLG